MNTDQHTVQQDSTTKLPSISFAVESTKSFLSQVRNSSSATKSSTSQRFDSYDPECLSPLDIPSMSSNLFSKAQDSGHKHHPGQKLLKVQVYNYFNEKVDTAPFYPVSEEETPGYSASTSVDTSQYLDSAQLGKSESEGSIPRQASQNEILSQLSEANSGMISRENSETIDNYPQTEASLVQAEPVMENEPVMHNDFPLTSSEIQDTSAETVNQTAANANNANNNEGNFVESLEFVLEKTPIITIFMSFVCLALTSGLAISVTEGKESHSFLFLVLYVFLMYLLIEKVFRMFRACRTTSPALSMLMSAEPFYNVLDAFAFIVIAIVIDLKLCEVISSFNAGLYFLIVVFATYCACARLSFKEKARGVLKRSFYIAQFLLLIYKTDNHVSFSWKIVFLSGWILLGSLFWRLNNGIYKVYKAFSGLNIVSAISKSAKVIGMMGLTFIGVDLIVLTMILLESCELLDTGSEDMSSLKSWLTICQYLNACLLFFTTITGTDLLEFIMSVAEHFNPVESAPVKPKELVMSKQETYVKRMSSTYYKIIEKSEVGKGECEKSSCLGHEGFEDNICYICCGNTANGLVLDCGHGGTCHECLSDYITRKDECMECRKKVNSILKVESEILQGKFYKGDEVWSIVRE